MASSKIFAHGGSGLDPFLFADINVQSGEFLTVASMLGRRGLDPWAEAMRLAALPVAIAVESLAAIIRAVPSRPSSAQDASALATHLIALLPVAGVARNARQSVAAKFLPAPLAVFILGIAIVAALVTLWRTVFDG